MLKSCIVYVNLSLLIYNIKNRIRTPYHFEWLMSNQSNNYLDTIHYLGILTFANSFFTPIDFHSPWLFLWQCVRVLVCPNNNAGQGIRPQFLYNGMTEPSYRGTGCPNDHEERQDSERERKINEDFLQWENSLLCARDRRVSNPNTEIVKYRVRWSIIGIWHGS